MAITGPDPACMEAEIRASRPGAPVVLVSAIALIDIDGRVLLAQRPAGKDMAGLWEFPGGKVAEGETPESALIREVKEELNIDITSSCLAPLSFASHAYEEFHLVMPLFACRVWKGTPKPLEGQILKWVRPVNMREFDMPPADEPLVAMLLDLL
ncbi:MAG: (deoxy)nucleoside triphosphate pyrophosphohydrolase [Rhodospirillales bacterium]|nr:(deoxy)nucleoside triphosphate pyrophosphohydrolase [Rhodospirillales bacterium]